MGIFLVNFSKNDQSSCMTEGSVLLRTQTDSDFAAQKYLLQYLG